MRPGRTAAALGLDLGTLGLRLVGYPLGVVASRRPLPTAAAGTLPVVLVHGIVDNRSAFTVLSMSLRRRGFPQVSTPNYPLHTTDVRAAARTLAAHVDIVCEETGADRVHLVGHSLGGLVARWYVQQGGGAEHVDTVVTLGTAHAGTQAARLLPLPVLRQMRPGSAVLAALAGPSPRYRVVSVWSEQDELVVPRSSAALAHPDLEVTDVRLTGIGHLALVSHPRSLAAVAAALQPTSASGSV